MRSAASVLFGAGLLVSVGWVAVGGSGNVSGGNISVPDRNASGDTFPCSVASITDGDTLRCHETGQDGRQIRVRLSGINARERDGSCSANHPCPLASADDATAELSRLAAGDVLSCEANGSSYRRVTAFCSNSAGVDLSCAMVESGTADRWDRYWQGHQCR